jgi:hypothetical protein
MPIRATCPHCEKDYSLPETFAAKTLRCKGCGQTFTVPAAGAAAKKASRAGAGRKNVPVREDEEAPAAKRPARKGGGALFWVLGLGVAAVLLVGCAGVGVVAVVFLWPSKATPENFARIKAGMSEKDVTDLMGTPAQGASLNSNAFAAFAGLNLPNAKTVVWKNGSSQFAVTFVEGKVVDGIGFAGGKVLTPPFAGDPLASLPKPGGDPFGGGDPGGNPDPVGKPDPGVKPNPDPDGKTRPDGKPKPDPAAPDFTRIHKGMSEQEVIKLVGEPTFKDELKSGEWQFSGLKKEDVLKQGGGFKKVTQFKYFTKIPVVEVIFVDGHVHHVNNA